MKILFRVLLLLVLGIIAAGLFVRFAPIAPETWHVDPLTAAIPDKDNHFLLRPEDGDGPAPVFAADRAAVAAAFAQLVSETPSATLIAGSPEAGHMTAIVRFRLVGFPDFVTVKLVETEDGTALAIFSRSKYGYSDMGVNKARVEAWLAVLEAKL